MKRFIIVGIVLFYVVSASAMETVKQQVMVQEKSPVDIINDNKQIFIENLNRVITKNGFNEKTHKTWLQEIKISLEKTNMSGPSLKPFAELATVATVLVKKCCQNERLYKEQVLLTGFFAVEATEEDMRKISDEIPNKKVRFSLEDEVS